MQSRIQRHVPDRHLNFTIMCCERRPNSRWYKVVLLEPVGARMMPTTDKTVEHLHDLICTLRSIVWQRRLGWSDLKRRSPLRVTVEFEGKFRLLQPDENVVQCVPVLLWETELHWLHLPRCGFLWKQETERVQLRITHTIKSRTRLTLFSDLIFEFSEDLFDDTSDLRSQIVNCYLAENVRAHNGLISWLPTPTTIHTSFLPMKGLCSSVCTVEKRAMPISHLTSRDRFDGIDCNVDTATCNNHSRVTFLNTGSRTSYHATQQDSCSHSQRLLAMLACTLPISQYLILGPSGVTSQ